jgi:hypothetical protein
VTVEPRVLSVPGAVSSVGVQAVELARRAGLVLDPWQAFVLEQSLGVTADGRWAAFEVGLVVSRQNGKGAILEARELAGLFLLGERLLIHSAHQFDTSKEHFRRLLGLIEESSEFSRRIKRVTQSHGEEGIELVGGQRIRFRTRTKGGGRGFVADCLILDEAMILPESAHGALLPTLSARPNPQVWYTGSAVDRASQDDGLVLSRIRSRGLNGDPGLAYFEYSLDRGSPPDVSAADAVDRELWAQANPSLGIRISPEHVANEQRSMDARTFSVERLGVGDWPRLDGLDAAINLMAWDALADRGSEPAGAVFFAFDVAPDRSWATIAVAGRRTDELAHLEVALRRRGTGWLAPELQRLLGEHEQGGVVCDGAGPAGSLLPELHALGVEVSPVTAPEHGKACGLLFDAVDQGSLRHLGQPELHAAIRGAAVRPLGDAWAWSRKSSAVDISPLVAVTLAHWALVSKPVWRMPVVSWG